MIKIQLVATDLDGTFLRNDRSISLENHQALQMLGFNNIVRVAATGRNLKKVKDVLHPEVPFDFIVYSSGAGVFDWKKKEHISNQNISKEAANKLVHFFIQKQINFHAFYPAPENHKHWYFRGKENCEEFERYFNFNRAFATEIKNGETPQSELCQLLIIIPENDLNFENLKNEIESACKEIRVIRSSSPITKGFIWVEVFHRSVSKGNGVKQICDLLEIEYQNTIGIGNDYNDLDLLEFTQYSFLTNNAPSEIKNKFSLVPSNENHGFAVAIQPIV